MASTQTVAALSLIVKHDPGSHEVGMKMSRD